MTTIDLNGTTIEVDRRVTVLRVGDEQLERLIGGRDDVVRPFTRAKSPAVDAGAEARLEAARAAAETARKAFEDDRGALADEQADVEARRAAASLAVGRLQDERRELEAKRIAVLERVADIGDVPDPKPVRDALEGLRRLRDVKPKPSPRAAELADRWAAVRRLLTQIPRPPAPPEWLVTPALAALQEARDVLAEAERAGTPGNVDQAMIDAVERAHRQVLDAEQRVMAKASRGNKKRLDQATASERQALSAIGAASYGEYLQHIAPSVDAASGEDRVTRARAALADAEAVWEELHGGQASPDYTAAKAEEAAVRTEAHALLGDQPPDDQLERRLREHLETVVDTAWAERNLADALAAAGAAVDGDLEEWATSWLEAISAQQQRRTAIDAELVAIDERIAAIDHDVAEQQRGAFFGDEPVPAERVPLSESQRAVDAATAAQREAEAALEEARALGSRGNEPGTTGPLASRATEAMSGPTPLESEVWFVASVAARAASEGPVVLVDARAASSERALRALGKAAARRPVIVLGDDVDIVSWAEGLGDQATVRSL